MPWGLAGKERVRSTFRLSAFTTKSSPSALGDASLRREVVTRIYFPEGSYFWWLMSPGPSPLASSHFSVLMVEKSGFPAESRVAMLTNRSKGPFDSPSAGASAFSSSQVAKLFSPESRYLRSGDIS